MEKIINKTSLYNFHKGFGAKMAPFAGYEMPISYPLGTIKEHLWCRESAGLFDVSHMGQYMLIGEGGVDVLSEITPTDFNTKVLGKNTYTVLMNEQGGVCDDLIVTRVSENRIYLVVNAACKKQDADFIREHLKDRAVLEELPSRSLMALQGPKALQVLQHHTEENLTDMPYMSMREMTVAGFACYVSRSGYTGEDGFEISVDDEHAEALWLTLNEHADVEPVGLAARDSLRLEAGFILYGHDMTAESSPIEANISWVITKGHESFLGSHVIAKQKLEGVSRKRQGFLILDKGIAREGSEIFDAEGNLIGVVTSGGHAPSFKKAIGQAYIDSRYKIGDEIFVDVRGRKLKAEVHDLRFVKRS